MRRNERRTATTTLEAGCLGDYPARPGTQMALVTPMAPAGDLTSGVPLSTYGAGTFRFQTSILVNGVEPTIDAAAFRTNFQNALTALVPGVTASDVSFVKGAETTAPVPRVFTHVGTVSGTRATMGPTRDVQAWWLSVTGNLSSLSGFVLNGAAGLNRAIARAVAQSTSFRGFADADYRNQIPTDGATLQAQFAAGAACSGGYNWGQVYSRACTRLEGVLVQPPTSTPQPQPQPQQTGITAPEGVPLPDANATCAIRTQSKMFLRPTPTFATKDSANHPFPSFPAGTAVTVTGQRISEQGSLGLYPVSVAGRAGFGALDANDFAGCTMFTAPGRGSSGSGGATVGGGGARIVGPARIAPRTTPITMLSDTSGTSTYLYGIAAFVAVLALGGAVIYYQRANRQHRGHGAKANGRRRRRRGGGRRHRSVA